MEITKVVKPFIKRRWPNTFGNIVYVNISDFGYANSDLRKHFSTKTKHLTHWTFYSMDVVYGSVQYSGCVTHCPLGSCSQGDEQLRPSSAWTGLHKGCGDWRWSDSSLKGWPLAGDGAGQRSSAPSGVRGSLLRQRREEWSILGFIHTDG